MLQRVVLVFVAMGVVLAHGEDSPYGDSSHRVEYYHLEGPWQAECNNCLMDEGRCGLWVWCSSVFC